MSIWKKAISVATSAALLASLFTAVIAAPVAASVTVTSVGSIPVGGTSAGELTLLFTERSAAQLPNAAGTMTVTINDIDGGNVTFSGTPVKSAPGSLGTVSATVSSNVLTISWTASDTLNVETIQITGLKIAANTTATPGPVSATLGGDFAGFFTPPTTGTATGTILDSNTLLAGADSADVLRTSVCAFAVTGGNTANASFSDVSDSRPVTAVAAGPVPGSQTVTFGAGINAHPKDTTVTQVVDYAACAGALVGSVGVIGDSLNYLAPNGQTVLFAGENNQWVNPGGAPNAGFVPAGGNDLFAQERTAGFLKKDATITLTITTAGVTFSQAPKAYAQGTLVLTGAVGTVPSVSGVLSADKKSATWTVSTASTAPDTIQFWGMQYDVASTVASGTKVDVTLATSAGAVVPTSRSNAVVGRVLNVTATSPVVYIGENNQTAGQITIVETGPGFFVGGSGSNNTFAVCLNSGEQFASAPWAKVTAGDLKLREGDVVSPDNVVQGKAISGLAAFDCYYWTVWTASTAASTVVISGEEAGTGGVKINVPFGQSVGPVFGGVRTGTIVGGVFSTVSQAQVTVGTRMFRNQVAVTALSQPTIPVGSNGSLVGDIQIQETANGQLKAGEFICVDIVPNQNWNSLYDAYLTALNTANRPMVTASNGVVVSGVTVSENRCANNSFAPPGFVESFGITVQQQSTTGNGKIVFSNIHYATVNDAVEGPVQVNVYGIPNGSSGGTQIEFQSLISNARIGTKAAIAIRADSALGLIPNQGPWSTSTKVAAANKFITWRFQGGAALAGKTVRIYVATKNSSGGWGPFVNLTGRVANASGVAEFHWRATNTWVSVRAYYAGDDTYAPSWSSPVQGRWLS